MGDEILEVLAHESLAEGADEPRVLELQAEAFMQVARSDPWRVQRLHPREHLLGFFERVERDLTLLLGILGDLLDLLVDADEDLGDRRREIAILIDVADELLGEELIALGEVEEADLVAEVVVETERRDRRRLVVFAIVALLADATDLEAVEEDLLPLRFVVAVRRRRRLLGLRLLLLLRLGGGLLPGLGLVLLLFDELEERVHEGAPA